MIDGEIVALRDGRPDLSYIWYRSQRVRSAIDGIPEDASTAYVAFDLLYEKHQSLMGSPLSERRGRLERLIRQVASDRWVLSAGVVGNGIRLHEEVCGRELEGIVAKRLDSIYQPGKRSTAWPKMKCMKRLYFAIIGFTPRAGSFRSLILASDVDGELRHVGSVGSGFTQADRQKLDGVMASRRRSTPLVKCSADGIWIEPLYCVMRYAERTARGMLRFPVFERLVTE